jgi:hypothetical protein
MYLASLWHWAREKPNFWASIALAIGTALFIFLWGGPLLPKGGAQADGRLRLWATLLQLVGAGVAIRDLMRRAQRHGERGVLATNWSWLKRGMRIALRRSTTMQIHGTSAIMLSGSAALSGTGILTPRIEASLEARLSALEVEVRRIDQAQGTALTELRQTTRTLEEAIRAEAAAREAMAQAVAAKERDAAVGDLGVLWFGAWWVLIGTTLSGLAPELVLLVPPKP